MFKRFRASTLLIESINSSYIPVIKALFSDTPGITSAAPKPITFKTKKNVILNASFHHAWLTVLGYREGIERMYRHVNQALKFPMKQPRWVQYYQDSHLRQAT
jgi:hypothetical protein